MRVRTFRLQFSQFPLSLLKERLHVNERRVSASSFIQQFRQLVRIRLSRCYWHERGRKRRGDTPLFLYSRFQIMQKRSSFTFPSPFFPTPVSSPSPSTSTNLFYEGLLCQDSADLSSRGSFIPLIPTASYRWSYFSRYHIPLDFLFLPLFLPRSLFFLLLSP